MDTDSLIYNIKTADFYVDIADDVEEMFSTSGYDKKDARPLPIRKNKKVIGLMKDELGYKIMTEFIVLRPKLYSYKKLYGEEDKKCKGIKKCVVKKTLTFDDYKNCLLNPKDVYRSQLMFRSTNHEVHTIEVNKEFPHYLVIIGPYLGVLYLVSYHLSRTLNFSHYIKMPHSNFKDKSHTLSSGVGKCSCGQTFDYASEKDQKLKFRLHLKFCTKPRRTPL